MRIDRVGRSAALVLMCGALLGGCGEEESTESTESSRPATQPSEQEVEAVVERCLQAARQLKDSAAREATETACRKAVDDVRNPPSSAELKRRRIEECERQAAQVETPEIRKSIEESCDMIK